jgi:hypothetical protein
MNSEIITSWPKYFAPIWTKQDEKVSGGRTSGKSKSSMGYFFLSSATLIAMG